MTKLILAYDGRNERVTLEYHREPEISKVTGYFHLPQQRVRKLVNYHGGKIISRRNTRMMRTFALSLIALLSIVDLSSSPIIRRFGAPSPWLPTQTIPISPPSGALTKEVSKADISAGIKRHIDNDRRKSSDKEFHVNYRGKDLALDLMKVHDDRLSNLGGGKYFACVDMKATDGIIYDIDFLMAGQPGTMWVTETSVHKVNGKPLYNWKEEGGVWKRVRVP